MIMQFPYVLADAKPGWKKCTAKADTMAWKKAAGNFVINRKKENSTRSSGGT